jgi:nucleoside phosphorylase
MKTIVFVSALQEEIDALWADSSLGWSKPAQKGDAIWYREGRLNGFRIIAAAACEMGLVASAILTTKLILRWKPELVIAVGICAGRDKSLRLGDTIVSSASFLYRFGFYQNGKFGQRKRSCEASEHVKPIIARFETSWPGIAKQKFSRLRRKPRVILGEYAAADFVMKDTRVMRELRKSNRNFYALDMESYAIARAAEILKVPYGAVIVKSVSDHGTKSKTDAGREYVKSVSKTVGVELAKIFAAEQKPAIAQPRAVIDSNLFKGKAPQILALCPQMGTFELIPKKWKAKQVQVLSGYNTGDIPPVFISSDSTVIAAAMPKGHYGQVGAAIWSTIFAEACKPSLILVMGGCGGIKDETSAGDIVLANRAYHFQFGALKSGAFHPEIRSLDIHDDLRGFLFAYCSSHLNSLIGKLYARENLHSAQLPAARGARCHIAPLASSDLYVRDRTKIEVALGIDRKMVGSDMEAYAVMRAARHSEVRLGALVIRSVSDYADVDTDSNISKTKAHMKAVRRLSIKCTEMMLHDGLRDLVKRHGKP